MITVVSGLPRSGTSLMMQILEANGFDILTDNLRKPDENNPKGYYESEKAKSLMKDNSWLSEADGKAVKVIAQLVPYLSQELEYRVIFMQRHIDEILSSQHKMLSRLRSSKQIPQEILKSTFTKQVEKTLSFLEKSSNITFVKTEFTELFKQPVEQIKTINISLGFELDAEVSAGIIDPNLYRERKI